MLKKLLAIIVFLLLSTPVMAAEEISNDIIIHEMMTVLGLDGETHKIEVLSNHLGDQRIDDCNLNIRPLTQKKPVGLYSVLVTATRGEEVVATGQVRVRIRVFAEVVIANDRINRSSLMDPSRFTVARMEVTNLVEQPITSLDDLAGFRAKRNLKKGTIVTTGALEPIPDVERGHETLIVYNDGLCRVTAPGQALQSGLTGEYIKVKNKATNKVIVARIVDDNVVAVDP
ncbi:MAG: flagellar basal body P-ring formation protein FlgA [Candidatus Zixiibacteriota bacterium]|nr:MAG: flagellar basal body P-ring formation protein FlgA [candidate division Zixibacteria bacterium]